MSEPILITGAGAFTPLGNDLSTSWRALLAGEVVLRTGHEKLAPELRDYPIGVVDQEAAQEQLRMPAREVRRLDPVSVMAMAAAEQALENAEFEPFRSPRVAVVLGSGLAASTVYLKSAEMIAQGRAGRLSPFTIPGLMPNAPSCNVSLRFGSCGPSWTVSTACAAGLDAIGVGWMTLQAGMADVVIAGGSEVVGNDVGVGGMGAAKALSKAEDGDVRVLRPFDRNRKGTAVGEGAAVVLMERESHALARKAPLRARIRGYGCGADSFHITQPRPDGSGACEVMLAALAAGAMKPSQIRGIYTHGTGTPLNDAMEAKSIVDVWEGQPPPITSTKGQYGHTMGASGPINVCFAIHSLEEGLLPATVPCDDPDPELPLTPVVGEPQSIETGGIMINAFGFGGHNASLLLTPA